MFTLFTERQSKIGTDTRNIKKTSNLTNAWGKEMKGKIKKEGA